MIEYNPNYGGFAPYEEMSCQRCGVCCTKWQPPLDKAEAKAIARVLKVSLANFLQDYSERYPLKTDKYLLRQKDGACVFLRFINGLATCDIYEYKPETCRNWKPSLERSECQEGLRKRVNDSSLFIHS